MVSIIPYRIVWYVSKQKHKENLGTFGSEVERFEALWKRLNAFQPFWERMGAFSRLGRLASIIPYGMVWYGMAIYVSEHRHKQNLEIFVGVLDCLEACGKRLNAFRAFRERTVAFGRLGRLVSIIPYGMYGMYGLSK